MEKVSAMKKIALFLMIVGLAVALVACEGPVGKPGDKGDKGDKGDTGTTGTHGTPGINALLATNVAGTIRVNDKPGETAGTVDFGGTPEPFSVAGHFIGGAGDLAFKLKVAALETEYFIVALAADGMVTLTVPTPARTLPDMDGDNLATFTVLVTDANNIEAEKIFSVKRNLAPNAVREVYPTIENGVGTQNVDNPVNTDDMDDNDDATRPKLNQYVITLDVDSANQGDDLRDAEPTLVTIMAESSDVTKATVAVDGQKVIITGVAATAAEEPVMVTIKAVDAGGLESGEITTSITVVAAPTAAEDTSLANQSVTQGTNVVVNAVVGFFTPAEDLTYTATSSRPTVATVPGGDISGALTVTTVNVGDTTITLKAADTLGQYVTREFTVNVKAP